MVDLAAKMPTTLLPTDILFQTSYWARVKARQGLEPMAFDISSALTGGDVLILLKPCGDRKVAFVPQGPEHGPDVSDHGPYLEELSLALAPRLPPEVAFIRYDLPWRSPYAEEMAERSWTDFPEARLRELRMNMGTRLWNLRKSSMDLTVASTLIVDLDGSENTLLGRMKPKTRYNIGLADRKGVTVRLEDEGCLDDFYQLYCETAQRNRFRACNLMHFTAMFHALVLDKGNSDLLFLVARHEGDLLAGAIIGISGKKANFLYGASANVKRNHMAPYLLHWTGMRLARDRGCLTYDMGAVPPGQDPTHRFHGLYRFKSGFGGRVELRSGSWDFPLDQEAYEGFASAERLATL